MGPLLLNLFKFCGLVLQDVYELCSKVIWFAHFMPIWVCQVLQGPWWIYIYIFIAQLIYPFYFCLFIAIPYYL